MNEAWHWVVHDDGWLWIWLFWAAIAAAFEGVRDVFVDGWRMLTDQKREHELAVLRERRKLACAEADLAKARVTSQPDAPPGPCAHRRVTPVIAPGDELVAWLCKNPDCAVQLPRDWAVRAEDL